MSGFLKELGNQTSRMVSNITPVNIMIWGVLPFVISVVIIIALMIYVGNPIPDKIKVCTRKTPDAPMTDDDCKVVDNKSKRMMSVLYYLLTPLLIGLIFAGGFYKLGMVYHNPKLGMGLMAVDMIRG